MKILKLYLLIKEICQCSLFIFDVGLDAEIGAWVFGVVLLITISSNVIIWTRKRYMYDIILHSKK